MKILKITLLTAFVLIGSLAFIGWLAPPSNKSKQVSASEPTEAAVLGPINKSAGMVSLAKVVDWQGLPNDLKAKVSDFQRYHIGGSWEERNAVQFKRETAYYVKVVLDNQQLAQFSESDAFTTEKMLTENPLMLYGKYKNQWHFEGADGTEIDPTQKFNGFNTIEITRNGNTDEVWIGPIESKPSVLNIVAYQHRDKVSRVKL